MGYSILTQNGNDSSYVTDLITPTLSTRDEIDVNSIDPGSEVYVESEQAIYILDTNRDWQLKVTNGSGGGGSSYSAGKNIAISSSKVIDLDIPIVEENTEDSVGVGTYFAEIASSTAGTGYATQEELNNLSQQVEDMGSSIKTEQIHITDNTSDNISITNEQIKVSSGTAMTTITPTLITGYNLSKYRVGNTIALPNTSGTLVVDTDLQEIYDRLAQIEAQLS